MRTSLHKFSLLLFVDNHSFGQTRRQQQLYFWSEVEFDRCFSGHQTGNLFTLVCVHVAYVCVYLFDVMSSNNNNKNTYRDMQRMEPRNGYWSLGLGIKRDVCLSSYICGLAKCHLSWSELDFVLMGHFAVQYTHTYTCVELHIITVERVHMFIMFYLQKFLVCWLKDMRIRHGMYKIIYLEMSANNVWPAVN